MKCVECEQAEAVWKGMCDPCWEKHIQTCASCAYNQYNDRCGLNADGSEGEQGEVEDLDEFQAGGMTAIYGDDYDGQEDHYDGDEY